MRVGHGIDVHALVEGRPLVVGGVRVPFERGLAGHSDGDVLLHAIIDALLGAAGLGDIGRMFPSDSEQWRDADSRQLLALTVRRVREAGFTVSNLDSTIVAEAPKLAPHVNAIRSGLAETLGIDISATNVKATTSDGLGFTGRGEGIAAFATVLLA